MQKRVWGHWGGSNWARVGGQATKSWEEALLPISAVTIALPPFAEDDHGPDSRPGRAAEPAVKAAAQGAAAGALGRVQPPLRPLLAGHEGPRGPVGSGSGHTSGGAEETLTLHIS